MTSSRPARADPSAGGRGSSIPRRDLFERLSAGISKGVTLLSAPAGSGKTVLVRSWIDQAGLRDRVAWVTIERDERDHQRFWLAVVQRLRDAVGVDAFVEKLTPAPEFDGLALVERLLSELGSLEEPVVLVIDDLHELHSAEALAQIEVLLARRPSLLWVVLLTRRDPQLGLHRLRLSGALTEVRAADLRFSLDETKELLATSGVTVSEAAVGMLHTRTEGWAAGLRLAAISLMGHPDPERFVAEFSGSERTVADYLLAEVLQRQPGDVRRLLLRTSILDRVTGPLADALVEAPGSEGILHDLERDNSFVVSLDAEHTWFRYHELFADLLRLELRRAEPESLAALHRTAAYWLGQHGYVLEAVGHAQAAEDWPHASRLVADHSFSLVLDGQDATLHALLARFPPDALSDPELARAVASDQLAHGSLEGAAAYLALAERLAPAVPEERRHRFDVALGIAQLSLARRRGDVGSVLDKVQPLLAPATADTVDEIALDDDARAVALMDLGVTELWSFRPDDAEHHLEQGLELARRIGRPYIQVGCLAYLGLAAAQHSFVGERERSLEALAIAEAHGWDTEPIACVALASLGAGAVHQGAFAEAESWLERAERALRPELEPAEAMLVHFAWGMCHMGQRRLREALAAFDAAEHFQAKLATPHVPIVLTRQLLAQTQLRLGDTTGARETIGQLPAEDRAWCEARAAMAELHLAEHDPSQAVIDLAPVLDGEAPVILEQSVVLALLLDAIANDQLQEPRAAEADIERALDLAEPSGYIFPFVLTPVRELLERHPRHRTAHAAMLSDILDVLAGSVPSRRHAAHVELQSDLTESELRVLRFLPSNLSAPEIASELYLSTSTVKTHMLHIYTKLGAHRRTEAVENARELGLLTPLSAHRR